MRIGMGYDVHRLTADRKLILGGVEIPYSKGLLGHSDADVLIHAVWMPCSAQRLWEISGNIFPIQIRNMKESQVYAFWST